MPYMTLNCIDGAWDQHGRWVSTPRHHTGLDRIGVCDIAVAEHMGGTLVGVPPNKNGWKHQGEHRKGTFLIRQEGLPKQMPHHKKSQVM